MFDLIVDHIAYDFGVVNSSALSDPAWIFRKQIVQGTESITSLIAATEKLHQRRLTTVLEKYQALSQ